MMLTLEEPRIINIERGIAMKEPSLPKSDTVNKILQSGNPNRVKGMLEKCGLSKSAFTVVNPKYQEQLKEILMTPFHNPVTKQGITSGRTDTLFFNYAVSVANATAFLTEVDSVSSLPPSSNRRRQDPASKIKYALKDSQSQKEIASEIEKLDLEKLKGLLSYIARSRHIEVSYVLTKSIVRAIRRH